MPNLAQNTSQKKDDYGEIAQVISFPKPSLIQEAIVGIKKSENGYTKTPNYLVDDDYLVRMTGNALKCYVVINRFSEGFSRQNWAMESKFLQRKTGIKKPHTLFEAVKQLEELKLLSVHREDGKTNKFTIMHPCLKTAVPNSGTTAENGQWGSTENGHSTTAENGHTKKETLKENIKSNNEITREKFEPQNRSMMSFIEYHPRDLKSYSLKELTQTYSAQSDFQSQAKVSFPDLSAEQVFTQLTKLAQWSLSAEIRSPQKWMTCWLNWLSNSKDSSQTKPSNNKPPVPQKPKRHRYGSGAVSGDNS